ncbi:hypothetical protein [Alicyclobacillus fodiniaquatilis]|uniref:Aminoglycoside phosphotransferase domain-containing protein n=1 Tax=Alicyclobacillus fodiniaquatilis TaxID=1661150 RepID=A0ABW4JN43_9BACL
MHNVICEDKDHYCFLDFEYSRLCPMVFVMDVLGEPWESLPMDALADRALRAFLTGWNREADERIEWHDFAISYHCVRVYRKCYEFEGWLSELAKNKRDQQTREWAEQGAEQLMGLMHTAKQAIQA